MFVWSRRSCAQAAPGGVAKVLAPSGLARPPPVSDGELKRNLARHRRETQQQTRNLERAFETLGEDAEEQPSPTSEAREEG